MSSDGPDKSNIQVAESVERVLDVENRNSLESLRVLRTVDPKLVELIDDIATFVNAISEAFGASGEYDKYNRLYAGGLQEVKAGKELASMLRQATLLGDAPPNDPLGQAKVGHLKAGSFLVRLWLLMRFKRDLHWCVTDLLRQRLTPAKGYLRLQVETVAIMIASTDGEFAHQWLSAISEEKGRDFYNERHRELIVPIIKSHNLKDLYDQGSNAAQHSRSQGIMHGINQAQKNAPLGSTGFMYQEVSHTLYIAAMLNYLLQSHIRLLYSLPSAFPELDWTALNTKMDAVKVVAVGVNNNVLSLYHKHRAEIQKAEFNIDSDMDSFAGQP